MFLNTSNKKFTPSCQGFLATPLGTPLLTLLPPSTLIQLEEVGFCGRNGKNGMVRNGRKIVHSTVNLQLQLQNPEGRSNRKSNKIMKESNSFCPFG